MEHIKPQATHTVEHGHEESDVNVRLIVFFGAALFVSGIVIHFALWGMYVGLEKWHANKQPAPNPMMAIAEQQTGAQATKSAGLPTSQAAETVQETTRRIVATFPEPRLQPDEVRDFEVFLENQRKQLEEYAWIDQKSGRVRIPVSRAMELIAERGLPAATATASPTGQSAQPAAPEQQPAAKRP
jgi:hypothetical protein